MCTEVHIHTHICVEVLGNTNQCARTHAPTVNKHSKRHCTCTHTHTRVQSPKQLSRVPAQWLQHPSTNRWKVLFEVISGSVIKRRCGHVRFPPYTALWHPEATCGVRVWLEVATSKREGLLTTNTRLVHRWYGSSLCVSMGREKKLHLHDQKNPEGSILYTRHTEWRLSSLKRTHCFLDWMLFKAWHLDYFQIFPSF